LNVPLPDGAKLVSQILWGSIGWSVGSALGAAFAARECAKDRVVLFVGEGSLYVMQRSNLENPHRKRQAADCARAVTNDSPWFDTNLIRDQ
jgi:TPP-dependent 2-oxoacid decarboxylase